MGSTANEDVNGEFRRRESSFRHWVTADGRTGPSGVSGFAAESGRYHLYVSLACPWAHRTLIMRARKGLAPHIGVSVVHWLLDARGWSFDQAPGVVPDPIMNARLLSDIYRAADKDYAGRFTVPLLWDRRRSTIVNNESSDIMRMFDQAFAEIGANPASHYPEPYRGEIDALNSRIYETLNNGVYKVGFATTQKAYEKAFWPLVETLDELEQRLKERRFLIGDVITEADIRLFTTLIRFDVVYHGHFKCNYRKISEYPNLSRYLRDLYRSEGFGSTVDFDHIKRHYYESHRHINPTGIVPMGPKLNFTG